MQEQAAELYQRLAAAHLPALPQVLLRVLELCGRDDVGLAQIGDAVRQDTGIAARVVSIANSTYFSRGRTLDDINRCLAVLGTTNVQRIALNHSVVELFGRFKNQRGIDLASFWQHSLHCALLARQLASRQDYSNPEEAYLAGLMHDVGQLALGTVVELYPDLWREAVDEDDLIQKERQHLGLNHAEVGAWLAERWKLHPLFVDSLRYHHLPMDRVRGAHALVQIVLLSDRLAGFIDQPEAIPEDLREELGLEAEEAAELLKTVDAETRTVAELYGIQLPTEKRRPTPIRTEAAQVDTGQANAVHVVAAQTDSDIEIQAKLADLVSTRLLAQGMLPENYYEDDFGRAQLALAQGACLLFGIGRTALFLKHGDRLQGHSIDSEDLRIEEITLALPAPQSALGRAYAGEVVIQGGEDRSTHLLDEQILRALGGQQLLCLPLVHEGQRLGVLVLAIDDDLAEVLDRRRAMLAAFAQEAGRYLAQARKRQDALTGAMQNLSSRHELHARKIAHEVATPLSVVRNYLELLRVRLDEQNVAEQEIGLIETELRRVARIVQDLKQMDTGESDRQTDVNGLLAEVMQSLRAGRIDPKRIETELSLEQNLPRVKGDRDKIRQILDNLIANAVEAMPSRGSLAIAAGRWQGSDGRESVEISITDTGGGIPAEVMARLYQPVQSSKGGDHDGLGLHIVGGLVQELEGELTCRSGGHGTTFKLLLPTLKAR